MKRFRNELDTIPRTAWTIAGVVVLLMITVGAIIGAKCLGGHDPWSTWMLIWLAPFTVLTGVYVLLIGYVYGDARRRGMRHVVWMLIAIFVPNGIGILLYFLLRDQLARPCPACGGGCKPGLVYCPNCGAAVGRNCPNCKRPIEDSWKNCAHCGAVV